jgi:hypothetical protein
VHVAELVLLDGVVAVLERVGWNVSRTQMQCW